MSLGIIGLRGQQLGGPKAQVGALLTLVARSASGAFGPYLYAVRINAFLYGQGGGTAGNGSGAGGGAAAMVEFTLAAGQTAPWTITTNGSNLDGGSTILTLPNGRVVTAGGGKKTATGGGLGGVAIGGDLNRKGGQGGDNNTGNDGSSGEFGGAGGTGSHTPSGGSGGGGSGGFSDLGDYPLGVGNGYVQSSAGSGPGGGAGGGVTTAGVSGEMFGIVRRIT